jgi:hypothetical protein
MKLRQGEKRIAARVAPITVRMLAKIIKIMMKGMLITKRIDLMKLKHLFEFIIEFLNTKTFTCRKHHLREKYLHVGYTSHEPNSNSICTLNSTSSHTSI